MQPRLVNLGYDIKYEQYILELVHKLSIKKSKPKPQPEM